MMLVQVFKVIHHTIGNIVRYTADIGIEYDGSKNMKEEIVIFKVGDRVRWKYYSMNSNFKAHKDGCIVIGVIGNGKYMIRDYDSDCVEGIVDGKALLDDREAHRDKVLKEIGI